MEYSTQQEGQEAIDMSKGKWKEISRKEIQTLRGQQVIFQLLELEGNTDTKLLSISKPWKRQMISFEISDIDQVQSIIDELMTPYRH